MREIEKEERERGRQTDILTHKQRDRNRKTDRQQVFRKKDLDGETNRGDF